MKHRHHDVLIALAKDEKVVLEYLAFDKNTGEKMWVRAYFFDLESHVTYRKSPENTPIAQDIKNGDDAEISDSTQAVCEALCGVTSQVGGTHYEKLKVQPWDAMESWMSRAEFIGYLKGNIIKYIARDKNGEEDVMKAAHYMLKLKEVLTNFS